MTHAELLLPPRTTGHPAWRRCAGMLAALYLAAALPLILLAGARGRAGEDQVNFHEPTIHRFADQFPRFDFTDYLSATTPGYHVVLAALERVAGGDAWILQLGGASFTVLLLLLLARTVCLTADARWTECLAICLPFACSMYVFQSGVWMLPDNAGWLFVLACMALALRTKLTRGAILASAGVLVGLVLVRQVHLWAAGVLWAAAWVSPGLPPRAAIGDLFTKFNERMRALTPLLIASVPAFLVLGWFLKLWGGLTPPTFQTQYSRLSPASYAFVLALLGGFSVFFVGFLADPLADVFRRGKRTGVVLGALGGALAAAIPATTYEVPFRSSGLWNLVNKAPSIAGHTSPVIVAFSALGGAALVLWWRALPATRRWIFLGAFFGFAAAQMFSGLLWQRYTEPFVLMMLALMSASIQRTGAFPVLTARLLTPVRVGGAATLAALLAMLTAVSIWKAGPAAVYDVEKINMPVPPPSPRSTP